MHKFTITDEPFAVGYLSADSESKYVRTGAGYIEAIKAAKISFDSETGFPEYDFGPMACTTSWSTGQAPNVGWLLSKIEYAPEGAEDYKYIIDKMGYLGTDNYWAEFTDNEWDVTRSGSGWGGTWGGHAVPDLIDFARHGTDKIREKILTYKAKNPQADDFYEGLLLTLDAIELLCKKILDAAKAEYERSSNHKLEKIIKTFEYCPQKPARTFAEAVCVYNMIVTLDGVDSPGHFDWYMIDFWEKSDYAQSREALEDIWIYFHKTRTWNLCIGGSDENWNDKSNALTYEILKVARKYKFQTPNLTMRYHRNTPEKLMLEAAETIGCGMGMPVLYNDEVVCPALESLGIPPCDSHLYVMNGCNQIDIQGKSHMGLEDGEVNVGMALKYAIFNGYNLKHNKQIGAKTGEAEELDTFEKFYGAVKKQIMYLTDAVCSMANKAQKSYAEYTSNPIRSMTIEGCIEKGLDYKNSGPLYLHGQVLAEGVPELIDSLANIKKFVYEEKRFTLSEVRDALAANYEGYEKMQLIFKNSGLNFGNDIEYVDSMGKDIIDFYNTY
ncbi:MAG: pyruvate formate lyase family protein, partial [Clostridia bacterium]|nr:pyruvate formate lyase family protein [Clostridia bacterium]